MTPSRAALLTTFWLGALAGSGGCAQAQSAGPDEPHSAASTPAWAPSGVGRSGSGLPDFSATAKQAESSVVRIRALQRQDSLPDDPVASQVMRRFEREPGVPPLGGDRTSLGSGFVWSTQQGNSDVVTNRHVVEGADWVEIRLSDGRDLPAQVLGIDEATDLAVLRVHATLTPLPQADSRTLAPGQWVMAIGSPFGFERTVTVGVVSAVDRANWDPEHPLIPFIQTDVAINQGNSGGPLLNAQGQVVGVNSRILSVSGGYMGISLAIPQEVTAHVVQALQSHGRVERGWWGLHAQDLDDHLAQAMGMEQPYGAVITQIEPNSPAQTAGLKVGDTIVTMDDAPVQGFGDLAWRSGLKAPGQSLRLAYVRDGQLEHAQVVLGNNPIQSPGVTPTPAPADGALQVGEIPTTSGEHSSEDASGESARLRVTQVSTLARRAGLQVNDRLLQLNHRPVRDAASFFTQLRQTKGAYAALLVQRGEVPVFVALPVASAPSSPSQARP